MRWPHNRAAAALWKLDGCPSGLLEVTIASGRSVRAPSDVVLHRLDIDVPADRSSVGPIPVTSPSRTLLDLAAVVDPDVLELALEDALRRRLTSERRLGWQLQRQAKSGRRGAGALRRVIELRAGAAPTESWLETTALQVIRAASLPPPERQFHVFEGRRRVARLDLAYPGSLVGINCHGFKFHSGRRAWAKDLQRLDDLVRLGWRILHFTYDDARDPTRFIAELRAALNASLF